MSEQLITSTKVKIDEIFLLIKNFVENADDNASNYTMLDSSSLDPVFKKIEMIKNFCNYSESLFSNFNSLKYHDANFLKILRNDIADKERRMERYKVNFEERKMEE